MFVTAIIGLISNFVAIRLILKTRLFHNCFGYLMLLHTTSEAIILSIFVVWAVPMAISGSTFSTSYFGKKIVFKAINRFIAIFKPTYYRTYFSDDKIKFIIFVTIACSMIHCLIYFLDGCNFYFDSENIYWDYENTWCYDYLNIFVDFYYSLSLMTFVIGIDLITFGLVMKSGITKSSNKDFKLFLQTFSTSIVYAIMMITTRFGNYLGDGWWFIFLKSTITWECTHMIDGIIIVLFNLKKVNSASNSKTAITDKQTKTFVQVKG
uniref:G-protein coupled receptors family 1 profile domain-containing protein n=1 Tax=Panagrolaimus sp. JU765 TaxID=591449 RepID=A0AC34QSN8_9BILA